ncbi:hypothetical protein GCM10022278_19460 [Allohahella marinimesophila]|uniref:Transposase (putative) YhgA-like domain-containing protein n=2 Tax=Allohahella marinimesophila TaxID=1054972 RepID=A0ABP7PB24_9GAMM
MVRDLVLGFIPLEWVHELDFSSLEKLNSSYISDDLRERSDDIVWRVKFRGRWLYLYILLEFQSTIDRFMAVRLLTYVGLLYQDLIKSKQLPSAGRPPPVLPVVMYTGDAKWTAALHLNDLTEAVPAELNQFQPQLQYCLIDQKRYDAAELEKMENLTAALIRAELAEEPQALIEVLNHLAMWLDRSSQTELRRALKEYFGRILTKYDLPGVDVDALADLTEMQTMLSERVKEWGRPYREALEAGRKLGIEQGREEGAELAEAKILKRQLTKRFGLLDEETIAQIDKASSAQLELWLDQVLEAESLQDLLGES